MSNNYLKVGKLYSLSSTIDVSINGASFIHAIHNNHTSAVTVTIDGTYTIILAANGFTNFNIPIAFSTVKISTSSATVVYS